ncbi:MAG TPA: UTP--glucose-1-phosphate uridylyltransferase [Thermoplasmata archaeon]|nr:UTP--glucose-1-phosphate uridylyltransferase [Thermoplasmata archaeon]
MKVVIPAAGLGTRFLPATKSQPKEMLPMVDRPIIQYVVEEAIASGADDILIVTGRGKRALEDHFDHSPELSHVDDLPELKELDELSRRARIHFVRQREPQGLANAIECARFHTGAEAFGVLLGDTINVCEPPLLRQLWTRYERYRAPVLAVEPVPDEKVQDYGIISGPEVEPGVYRCERLVEKPTLANAPSHLGITGAYVLTPDVYEAIDRTPPDARGEVQLTDALQLLVRDRPVYAATFQGTRYDIGDRFLWLRTNLIFAWNSPELRSRLRPVLETLLRDSPPP